MASSARRTPQALLFRLRNFLIDLRPLSLIHILPPTAIPTIAVLSSSIDPPYPLSPSSAILRYPGGCGTSTIHPTIAAFTDLFVPLGSAAFSYSAPSDPSSAPTPGSSPLQYLRLYAMAWIPPSIPASRPAHSWILPHNFFT